MKAEINEHKMSNYYYKLIKATKKNHMIEMIKPRHSYRIKIKEKNPVDLQKTNKMDNDNKMELDESKQKKERKKICA
ncbi:19911_t:CDS:1, partial [Gigaspora margarita]